MKNLMDCSMNRMVLMTVTSTVDICWALHVTGKEGCYEVFRCS